MEAKETNYVQEITGGIDTSSWHSCNLFMDNTLLYFLFRRNDLHTVCTNIWTSIDRSMDRQDSQTGGKG